MSAAPERTRTRAVGLAVVGTVLHGALLFGLLVVYVSYVPAAKRALDEFGVALPWLTLSVIRLSNWLSDYWWTLVPVTGVLGIVNFAIIWALGRRGTFVMPLAWTLSVALLFFALGAIAVYAIELPMAKLREGLAK